MTWVWTQQTAAASWDARDGSGCVCLSTGEFVLIGGDAGAGDYRNDVWISSDKGANWTQQTAAAGWAARTNLSCTVLSDDSIIIAGGLIGPSQLASDVWISSDKGVTWTRQSISSGWGQRSGIGITTLTGDILLLTGGYIITGGLPVIQKDVWISSNKGITWTLVTAAAAFGYRSSHCIARLYDNSIIVAGGNGAGSSVYSDVWRSTDSGVTWVQQTSSAGWGQRTQASMISMATGTLIFVSGRNSSFTSL